MAVEAEVGAGKAAKKGIPKLFIIIGAALAVVLIGGAGLFFLLSGSGGDQAAADHGAQSAAAPRDTFIFNLPSMMVNLNSEGGSRPAYMKLTIALEVADEAMMTQIQPRLPKVVDAFQVYMRELRRSDLEGSAGIYRLKEELLRRVNLAIYPARVESVLFKEILVQ